MRGDVSAEDSPRIVHALVGNHHTGPRCLGQWSFRRRPRLRYWLELYLPMICALPDPELRMNVALESPKQPEVVALIADLDAYQDSLYPAEARYALDLDALARPHVLFAVARDGAGLATGCGAIVLNDHHGEIKRMFVLPEARGHGTAGQIIEFLEAAARSRGCQELLLETGPYQPQALAFYSKQGYDRCGPFGDYPDHPLSIFMRKQLAA